MTGQESHRESLARGSLLEDEEYGLPFKRRLSLAYETYERPALFVLALTSLVLGFIGFHRYLPKHGRGSYVDALLSDVDLFKLRPNVGEGHIPLELNIARVLAPLVAGLVAFRSAAVLFRDRLDQLRTRRRRNHVVVVGCNSASWPLIRSLRRANTEVIVVDDMDQESVSALRSVGAFAVTSRRTAAESLHQARVERATHVIAMLDDDFVNLDYGLNARRLLASRRDQPQVLVCGHQPDFCGWLRLDDLSSQTEVGARLDFISGDELLAHTMVDLIPSAGTVFVSGPPLIEAHVLLRLARSNSGPGDDGRAGWSAVITDRYAGQSLDVARRTFAGFDSVLTVTTVGDLEGAGQPEHSDMVGAIVCGDDATTVVTAFELANRLPRTATVIAGLPGSATFQSLVPSTTGARVRLVDTAAWAGDLDLILGGTYEVIARAAHERYRSEQPPQTTDPSAFPWDRLSPQLKASNRAQARHLGVKLASIGATLAPLGGHAGPFSFTPEERERLSIMEHDRWVLERRDAGWTAGPRDSARLTTPHLVPWEELDEKVRDLDRSAIDGLPSFLAGVGYRIERLDAPAAAS